MEYQNLNILIVEDDSLTRKLLSKSFSRNFKNVTSSENGYDGYLKFKEHFNKDEKFDLIVSDINMPRMNGLEMLSEIRKVDENVPVVFLTARTELENIKKSMEMSAIGYLLKPLDFQTINERVEIILKDTISD